MSKKSCHLHAFQHQTKGATALEFALISIPMILFFVGIMEFGRAVYSQHMLSFATERAARAVYLNNGIGNDSLHSIIRAETAVLDQEKLIITLSELSNEGQPIKRIDLRYEFTFLVPNFLPSGITIEHRRDIALGS